MAIATILWDIVKYGPIAWRIGWTIYKAVKDISLSTEHKDALLSAAKESAKDYAATLRPTSRPV